MKFKRLLAAILGALMITSCMSFVAGAEEAKVEADIEAIEEVAIEEAQEDSEEEAAEEAALAEEATEEGTETVETVTISFDKTNGGYPSTGAANRVSTVEVAVGDVIPFPANPTYVCHTFKGWSTSDGGEVIADTSNITATTAQTYYAIWEYTHTGKALAEINAKREYKDNSNIMAAEGCNTDGKFYDAIEDKIFENYNVRTSGSSGSCNMYSGFNYSIAGTELYMAAFVRTNMTGYAGTAGIYNSVNKAGTNPGWTALKQIDTITEADTWTKVILKSTGLNNFGWGKHIDYDVTGGHPAINVGTDYYDVVGMALFNTQAEAEAYDFDTVASSDYQVCFNVNYDNAENVTAFPSELSTKRTDTEGNVYCLEGWTTDETLAGITVTPEEASLLEEEGVILSEYDLRRTAIPTAEVTYYAVWGDVVEEENAVYLDAVNGNDENGGRHSNDAVATLTKAEALLAGEGLDTLYIIGTYAPVASEISNANVKFGVANKKIYIKGYPNSGAMLDMACAYLDGTTTKYMNYCFSLKGDLEMDNITFFRNGGDGGILVNGHSLTIGEGLILAASGGSRIAQDYYNKAGSQKTGGVSTINVPTGKWYDIGYADYTDGTFTGNVVINLSGNASVANRFGHGQGYGSAAQVFKGTATINVSDNATAEHLHFMAGTGASGEYVYTIPADEEAGTAEQTLKATIQPNNKFYGARFINLNGGNVKKISLTSVTRNTAEEIEIYQQAQKAAGKTYRSADSLEERNADITVVTVNEGATVGSIVAGESSGYTEVTNGQRIVIFNNGATPVTVGDTGAVVIDVTGANLTADVTVAADYTTTLNGYTYELARDIYDTVIINGGEPVALSTLENGLIPATAFEAGQVNTIVFTVADNDTIKAYREAGYEIVYTASAATGTGDGSAPYNAYNGFTSALSAKTGADKKIAFVLLDDVTIPTTGATWGIKGGEAVITSMGAQIHLNGNLDMGGEDRGAHAVFDNVTINKITGERGINLYGNDLTLAGSVIVNSTGDPMHINAHGDGNPTAVDGNTITIETPSKITIRGCGWSGGNIVGNVTYNIKGNANITNIATAGKVGHASNVAIFKGDATINVSGNAKVANLYVGDGRSTIDGNFYVNVSENAEVTSINCNKTVTGNAIIRVTGGKVGTINGNNANVAGRSSIYVDTDKAEVTTVTGQEYALKVTGNTGTVTPSEDYTTMALTFDSAVVEYIRIINGENKKDYNVSGEEVSLLEAVDFSAIPLEAGLTEVIFYETDETEEIPAEVTLNFYANIPDENGDTTASNAAAWVTKTSAWGASDSILPTWSDVMKADGSGKRENVGSNDIFAYPDRPGYRFLGWADTATAEAPTVDFGTFTIDADAYRTKNYYAVWEQADMLTDEEITVTMVTDKALSPIPEYATAYTTAYADGKYTGPLTDVYNVDGSVYSNINTSAKVPGLSQGTNTTTASYHGSSSKGATTSVLFPEGTSTIWYKWTDGKYMGFETPYTGRVNVAYVLNAAPSATTARGFWISAGNVEGTYNLTQTREGNADFVVSFATDLEAGDIIKYAAPYDFNDDTIKAAQLAAIYVWPQKEVYLSDSGDDANDGFTADAPVKTLARVQAILGENSGMDTVKIVGTYTYRTRIDLKSDGSNAAIVNTTTGFYIGIPGRTITVTGADENAMFSLNDPNANDEILTLRGDVTFENIKYEGSTNDGRVMAYGGYSLTFGEGITASKNTSAATENNHAGTINILSGSFTRVYPGSFGSSAQYQPVTLNVDGDGTSVGAVALGHGWHNTNGYFGAMYVNVTNGAKIGTAKIQSNGTGTVAKYSGLRYFTVDASVIENVYTTGKAKQSWSGGAAEVTNAADRTGITVFEFNNGSTLVNPATAGDGVDSSTRIFVFNSGSTGTVNDTGAIVIRPQNGTIHPDVTANVPGGSTRATATLNGYRYTTDATNEYIYINGTNYLLSDFANAGEEASLSEEVTVLIPAELFTAESDNVAVFSEAPLYTVTWKNGEETIKTELVVEGSTLTAPAVNKASTKAAYYTFKTWNDGTQDIADITAYTVPAGGATFTAVFEEHAMPASASIQYSAFSQVNNVAGVFTQAVETIDGVEAVKITPASDSEIAINLEGSGKYPENYSTGAKTNVLDPVIYDYAVYRYYYVPGTNTEDRTFYIWYQKHPWEDTTLVASDAGSFTMEAGKWTYIVDKLDRADGKEPDISIQYHLRPMNTVAAKTLAANGEYLYLDGMQLFSAEPTVATVTFKGEDDTVLYAVDALNSEAVTYNGAAVSKDGYTFKGWALENSTEVVEALTFAEDTTLVPVFEENPQEVFPTTPTYKTYGVYDEENGIYEVELRLSGTTANVGSFGFAFPANCMTLVKVEANNAGGVALLPEETSELAQISPIFVKDTVNGYYANTFTGELAAGYGYVDATESEVLIATFTFTMTPEQRTAFEETVLGGTGKFAEYVVDNADAKYYNNGSYLVAPFVADLSTNKLPVEYVSHSDDKGEVAASGITLKVNFIDDKGSYGTSLATVKVNGEAAVVIEQEGNTNSVEYAIDNVVAGTVYKIVVEKNGYISGICEVTATGGMDTLEMTLIAGDIKGTETAACGDGKVDLDDFVRLIRAFDPETSDNFRAAVDINEDGSVSVSDIGYVKSSYGKTTKDTVITFNGATVTPGITE